MLAAVVLAERERTPWEVAQVEAQVEAEVMQVVAEATLVAKTCTHCG